MNLKRLMIMAAALCLAVGAVSCKKDKDDDSATSKSFSGTLSVQGVLPFVLKGTTVTAAPAGLGKEKVDIGYYWTASPLYTKRDTTRRLGDPSSVTGAYECKIKDTLCTVTVSCTAYATGYYTKSASAYCTIVDPAFGGSLKNDGVSKDMPSITDARDGNVYYYRKIGDKDWFVRNLAYKESGYPFRKSEVMDAIFGRYYTDKLYIRIAFFSVYHNTAACKYSCIYSAYVCYAKEASVRNIGYYHSDLIKMCIHQKSGGIVVSAFFHHYKITDGVAVSLVNHSAYRINKSFSAVCFISGNRHKSGKL